MRNHDKKYYYVDYKLNFFIKLSSSPILPYEKDKELTYLGTVNILYNRLPLST